MKKVVFFVLCIFVLVGCGKNMSAVAKNGDGIKIYFDDKEIYFNEYFPYVDDNKIVQFPLKYLETIFHMNVNWNNDKLTAFISSGDKKISLRVGDNNFISDSKSVPMPSIVYEIDGNVYFPIESVLKYFGYETNWDFENKKLYLKSPKDKNINGLATFNFAFKLAEKLGEDYLFSPLSIKFGLAMLANGCDSETKNQLLEVLSINDLDEYNNYVENFLLSINTNSDFKLDINNSVWVNENVLGSASLKKNFVSMVEKFFNATASKINNKNAVEVINNWISSKTNNKIKNAVDSPDFLSALINTIYFSGRWEIPFIPENNFSDYFISADGTKLKTDFMTKTDFYLYCENDNYKMVSLPYKNSDVSMCFVLPKQNDFSLTQINFNNLQDKHVDLKIPKFKFEFSMENNLKEILSNMGVKNIFTGYSPENMFDGLNTKIKCDKIVHKSFIDINEYGTEAAAATLVMINKMSMPIEDDIVKFYADRPFYYFIRDNSSDEILFAGKCSKISK